MKRLILASLVVTLCMAVGCAHFHKTDLPSKVPSNWGISSTLESDSDVPSTTVKKEKSIPVNNLEVRDNNILLYWDSEKNEKYVVFGSHDLRGWKTELDNIKATPPVNVYSEAVVASNKFFRVEKK